MYVNGITDKSAKVDKISVEVTVPNQEAKTYELAKQEDGTYSIENAELVTAIDASGDEASGITAKVSVTVDGKDTQLILKTCIITSRYGATRAIN